MSIKMHHFLRILISSIFMLIGFAILCVMLFTERIILGFIIGIMGFIASGYLGHKFSQTVPAACPKCSGKAYAKKSQEGRLYFECVGCGHKEMTGFSDKTDITD